VASPLSRQQSPEDQRNVIIATVLVAVILFGWMFFFSPQPPQNQAGGPAAGDTTQQMASAPDTTADTTATADTSTATADADPGGRTDRNDVEAPPADSITAAALEGTRRTIVVETDLYTAVLSTKGAALERFTLKEYLQFNQKDPVQLVDTTAGGTLSLAFTTPTNRRVDTRSLYFSTNVENDTVRVTDQARSITFEASLGEGALRQTYTFHPNDYDLGLAIEQVEPASFTTDEGYQLVWHGGMPYSEGGEEDELQYTGLYAWTGGTLESLTLSDQNQNERRLSGDLSWLAVKNKYFTAAMMPADPSAPSGALLAGGKEDRVTSAAAFKDLTGRVLMPRPVGPSHTDRFHIYAGPTEYSRLAAYNRSLYEMIDYGWWGFEWLTKPLATWFYIPLLTYLGGLLPYGVVVILFAVIIKTAVYPLTKSSYRSMAQMRELQPKMQEIKDEYGDDPEKQQEKMMELYRETGVNPLGGCLPMFLQYPILISLYQFIPKSIQLRQESFLWAADLSAPDKILQLPFTIPFYGDYVAGFTLLMGLSMIVTMRMQSTSGAAGGQAKAFMYAMPAVIFFIFNRFASALSLYYLFYNLMTAGQQWWINRQLEQEKDEDGTLSNGRADDESKGFFARLLEKAEEAQKEQRG